MNLNNITNNFQFFQKNYGWSIYINIQSNDENVIHDHHITLEVEPLIPYKNNKVFLRDQKLNNSQRTIDEF
jgi:hypothetical protein